MNLQKIVLTFFLIFSTFYFVPHVSAISLSIGDPDEIYGLWEDTRDQLNKDWQLFTEQKPVGDAYEEQFDKMISHIRQLGMLHRKFSAVLDIEAENNITIIYPNGGETFECDNTYPLAWSIDIAPNQTSIDALTNPTVGIYLSLLDEFGNGFIAHNIVTEMDAEIGKYKWTVPCELRDGSYSIRIVVNPEAKIISYEDTSDAPFDLVSTLKDAVINSLSAEKTSVVSGETINLSWSGSNVSKYELFFGSAYGTGSSMDGQGVTNDAVSVGLQTSASFVYTNSKDTPKKVHVMLYAYGEREHADSWEQIELTINPSN